MKLILDTNVVLDWLVFEDPFLAPFVDRLRQGRVTLVTHPMATEELRRVLAYPDLGLAPEQRCRDPDDDHFLALTFQSGADALVSRDRAVLALSRRSGPFGFRILNVRQLIVEIERS